MHIGRGDSDVAQGWRAETAHILGPACMFLDAHGIEGIGAFAIQIIEAVVVKADLGLATARRGEVVGEIGPGVAVIAFQIMREVRWPGVSDRLAAEISSPA